MNSISYIRIFSAIPFEAAFNMNVSKFLFKKYNASCHNSSHTKQFFVITKLMCLVSQFNFRILILLKMFVHV